MQNNDIFIHFPIIFNRKKNVFQKNNVILHPYYSVS